jgi:hypothetical protein
LPPPGCDYIFALLLQKDSSGKEVEVGRAHTLEKPAGRDRYWCVAFTQVKGKGPFTIKLYNADDHIGPLDTRTNIKLKAKHPNTDISYPLSGDQVPASFTAQGPTDQSSVTAQLATLAGAPVTNVPATLSDGGWFATFSNVMPGDYTLNVFDTANPLGGNPAARQSPIHVRGG